MHLVDKQSQLAVDAIFTIDGEHFMQNLIMQFVLIVKTEKWVSNQHALLK